MKKTGVLKLMWMLAVMLLFASCTEKTELEVEKLVSSRNMAYLNEMTDIAPGHWMNGVHVQVSSSVREEAGTVGGIEETFVLTFRPERWVFSREAADNGSSKSTAKKKKTVVRTTIKCIYFEEYARSEVSGANITPMDYLMVMVRENETILKNGGSVSFKVTMFLDGLMKNSLYDTIEVPPYTIHIENHK